MAKRQLKPRIVSEKKLRKILDALKKRHGQLYKKLAKN